MKHFNIYDELPYSPQINEQGNIINLYRVSHGLTRAIINQMYKRNGKQCLMELLSGNNFTNNHPSMHCTRFIFLKQFVFVLRQPTTYSRKWNGISSPMAIPDSSFFISDSSIDFWKLLFYYWSVNILNKTVCNDFVFLKEFVSSCFGNSRMIYRNYKVPELILKQWQPIWDWFFF